MKHSNIYKLICVTLVLTLNITETYARVGVVADTVSVDTRCSNGRMARGRCPQGYEYVAPSQLNLLFESFEYQEIPVNRTFNTPPDGNKWRNNQVDSSDDSSTRPNNLYTSTSESLYGSRSLQLDRLDGGTSARAFQLFLYNNHGNASNDYHYVREETPGWETGRINRARVWIKAPPTMVSDSNPASGDSIHFGSYTRRGNESTVEQESSNGHFYHYFNVGYDGDMWHQLIVDTHPSTQRGTSGSLEIGVIDELYPDTDPDLTYFDLITYFYLDHKSTPTTYPATWYFDGFEFYEELNDEDTQNIYSLYGIYNNISGEIVLGWKRPKDDPDVTFDIRYADTSFHDELSFDTHGSPAPNGTAINNGRSMNPDGYNNIDYREVIDVSGRDFIYVGIKASTESNRFREIRIPVTANGYPTIGGNVEPNTTTNPHQATSPVTLPTSWFAYGDSQTGGRASETNAESPMVAFERIYIDSGYGTPTSDFSGLSGNTLGNMQDTYNGDVPHTNPSWLHFQDSGSQKGATDTQEMFGDTLDTFVNTAFSELTDSATIISTETAFSFGREAEAGRNWDGYNDELRTRLAAQHLAGKTVYIAETDAHIKSLQNQVTPAEVWFQVGEANAYHYKGLGNLMIALAMFESLGYDVDTLDLSGIPEGGTITNARKQICLDIIKGRI